MKKIFVLVSLLLLPGIALIAAPGDGPFLGGLNTYDFHGGEKWNLPKDRQLLEYEQQKAAEAAAKLRAQLIGFVKHGVKTYASHPESAWQDYEDALHKGLNLWAPAEELDGLSPVEYARVNGAEGIYRRYNSLSRQLDFLTSRDCADSDDENCGELPFVQEKIIHPKETLVPMRHGSEGLAGPAVQPAVEIEPEEAPAPEPVKISRADAMGLLAAKIGENDATAIRELVSSYRLDVNRPAQVFGFEPKGDEMLPNTPLAFAAYKNAPKAIKTLIALGADANAKPDLGADGKLDPALFVAIKYLNESAAVALLEDKARVNVKDRQGRSAVLFASLLLERAEEQPTREKIYRMVETLLKSGANPNSSLSRETILKRAEKGLALDKSIPNEIRFAQVYAANPLMFAVAHGDVTLAKILLNTNAKVDFSLPKEKAYPNAYRMTPLMLAAEMEDVAMVKLLLAKGADVRKADKAGRRALSYALRMDEANVVLKGPANRISEGLKAVSQQVEPDVVNALYAKGARLQGEVPTQMIRGAYAQMKNSKMTKLIDKCDAISSVGRDIARSLSAE